MADTQTTSTNTSPAVTKVKAPRGAFINSIWADITGAVITVGSGLIAARQAINNAFFQNIKIIPEIGGEKGEDGRSIEGTGIMERSRQGAVTAYKDAGNMGGAAAAKNKKLDESLARNSRQHQKELDDFLANNYGIKNAWHRFNKLRPHQKIEVATKVGATMAVTLGAVATVAALRQISNDQKDLEARLSTMEDTPRTL